MSWAMSSPGVEENKEEADEAEGSGEGDIPKGQFSKEMYEELEERVNAYQSLLQSHDQEVQDLTSKLTLAESEKAEMKGKIDED